MTTDKSKRVLRHLLQDHKGRQNAITQGKLAKKMDMDTSTLRSELRRLREDRDIPIGNLRNGYFVIQDREELQEQIGHINGEIESKRERIEDTLEAFESFDGEDIEIDPKPDTEPTETSYACAKCGSDVPKSEAKYPQKGENPDKPHCSQCYGKTLMKA